MLNYGGNMAKKKYRIRTLILEIDDDERTEVLAAVSEARSSLVNNIFHKAVSKCTIINGNLGDLFLKIILMCIVLRCQYALLTF